MPARSIVAQARPGIPTGQQNPARQHPQRVDQTKQKRYQLQPERRSRQHDGGQGERLNPEIEC